MLVRTLLAELTSLLTRLVRLNLALRSPSTPSSSLLRYSFHRNGSMVTWRVTLDELSLFEMTTDALHLKGTTQFQ